MNKYIENYKDISLEIISLLENKDKNIELDTLFNKRQEIITKIEEHDSSHKFKMLYHKNNITKIDEKIKTILQERINEAKKDIKEHKLKEQGSNAYANINKNNLNLFYEKV